MSTTKTAIEAIAESIQTTSTIHLLASEVSQDDLDTLLAECDDSVDTQHGTEYWGSDDGAEWRVHVEN